MLGHRGCRLGITYPEIYNMQTKAIFNAVCELYTEFKIFPNLDLMIPFVSELKELSIIKENITRIANKILKQYKYKNIIQYKIGIMIELPRAAILANELAEIADFFSFGTNDLTQTTLGFSRDDASKFIPIYIDKQIYKEDPFVVLDEKGVGELMKIAI